jgi:hypothetical protein
MGNVVNKQQITVLKKMYWKKQGAKFGPNNLHTVRVLHH